MLSFTTAKATQRWPARVQNVLSLNWRPSPKFCGTYISNSSSLFHILEEQQSRPSLLLFIWASSNCFSSCQPGCLLHAHANILCPVKERQGQQKRFWGVNCVKQSLMKHFFFNLKDNYVATAKNQELNLWTTSKSSYYLDWGMFP